MTNLVVLELNVLPVDAFFEVLLLFVIEDMLVEVMLKMFIRPIDAELLECIVVS